jgi:hypothetical protein
MAKISADSDPVAHCQKKSPWQGRAYHAETTLMAEGSNWVGAE